jgi:hypothetical protein
MSLSKPLHDEPAAASKEEPRRQTTDPMTKKQKVSDDLIKINKVTAVMAVYNNDAWLAADRSGGPSWACARLQHVRLAADRSGGPSWARARLRCTEVLHQLRDTKHYIL